MSWIINQNVYKNRSIGIPKKLDLNKLENKSGLVKFIVSGKKYWFRHADDDMNRVSGIGEARGLFKGKTKFECYYDPHQRAIVINFGRRIKLSPKTKRKRAKVGKSLKGPNDKEKFFLKKIGLKENEYEYKGNIRGTGYDFEIKGYKSNTIGKYVEVKGINNKYHTINLTKKEYAFAKKHPRFYVIYLIENWGSKRIIYKIPFGKLNHRPDAHTFRFRKKEMYSFETI